MPLLNPRHERFAQALAAGRTRYAAYREAGYHGSAPRETNKLVRRATIVERLRYLQGRAAQRAEIDGSRVLAELGRLAFSDVRDVAEWGGNGVQFRGSADLGDDAARSVKRVKSRKTTVRKTQDGGVVEEVTVELELHDKKGALDSLGKALGLFAADQPPAVPIQINVVGPALEPKGGKRS